VTALAAGGTPQRQPHQGGLHQRRQVKLPPTVAVATDGVDPVNTAVVAHGGVLVRHGFL
jgi:hypothetical protein